jgi:hypothetical protein
MVGGCIPAHCGFLLWPRLGKHHIAILQPPLVSTSIYSSLTLGGGHIFKLTAGCDESAADTEFLVVIRCLIQSNCCRAGIDLILGEANQ